VPILTPTVLAAAYNTTDGATFTTASLAVLPNRILVLWADTSIGAGTTPGVSPSNSVLTPGCVWKAEADVAWPTDVRHGFMFTAPTGTQPVPGTMVLTMTERGSGTTSTGTGWAVLQFPPGVDVTKIAWRTSVGSVNSTGLTLTLVKASSNANRFAVFFSHRANEVTTPRAAPWAELSDVAGASPTRSGEVQWLQGTVSVAGTAELAASATWATSSQGGGLALELRAQPRWLRKQRLFNRLR